MRIENNRFDAAGPVEVFIAPGAAPHRISGNVIDSPGVRMKQIAILLASMVELDGPLYVGGVKFVGLDDDVVRSALRAIEAHVSVEASVLDALDHHGVARGAKVIGVAIAFDAGLAGGAAAEVHADGGI